MIFCTFPIEIPINSGLVHLYEAQKWLREEKFLLIVVDRLLNGEYVFSTRSSGAITGVVKPESVVAYKSNEPAFKPYLAKITANLLNVRAGAGTEFAVKT